MHPGVASFLALKGRVFVQGQEREGSEQVAERDSWNCLQVTDFSLLLNVLLYSHFRESLHFLVLAKPNSRSTKIFLIKHLMVFLIGPEIGSSMRPVARSLRAQRVVRWVFPTCRAPSKGQLGGECRTGTLAGWES